jgi:leucine dehydrogenase
MSVWTSPEFDNHEQVCFFTDAETGLRAIVAIHSTALGAAAGGTRFMPYSDDSLALDDALRLSRAMSYKSALAGVPCGGGKSVIIGDPALIKTTNLLHAYGKYIDRLGHYYATGEDVGMSVQDIETIRDVTPYAGGTAYGGSGDPSIHTATGVIHGLKAVLEHRFDRSDFDGVSIAVQGLGAVGWRVAEALHEAGAILTVADIREAVVAQAVVAWGAKVMPTELIHSAEVDIFVPCALGGVITPETARGIRARAVAGAANNQLASREAGEALAARDILYAPDYVINAGGIISALEEYYKMPGRTRLEAAPLAQRLETIHSRLGEIFERSVADKTDPDLTARRMAVELIGR